LDLQTDREWQLGARGCGNRKPPGVVRSLQVVTL
jgi:hypothetical protein